MKNPHALIQFVKANIGNIFIIAGITYILIGFWPVIGPETSYWLTSHFPKHFHPQNVTNLSNVEIEETKTLWDDLGYPPINTDFSIVIPKINVNAPIVTNVSLTNSTEYLTALQNGVAQAQNTPLPSQEIGNTYLFAHSTPNIFDIQKYSAVFTLLNKLEQNDRIVIYYKGTRFDYIIEDNEVVESFNLSPITRTVDHPTLTLQTCDPPGIPINRRIVTAKLDSSTQIE